MSQIGHNKLPLDPQETIKKNIVRRKPIIDSLQFYNNVPLPSWIELSLIDTCNRTCSFCPRSDESIAPNTHQKMERLLIDKMHNDLKDINYKGAFCLCGYGEPLLYKDINYTIEKLSDIGAVEIITNGDPLNKKKLKEIYNGKISRLIISLYDGPKQLDYFKEMIKDSGIGENLVILRDRWYSNKKDYGVKLTNRAGTISIGNQPDVEDFKEKKCFYPSYSVLIDWNGDIFLCPQDWQRRISIGNLMQKHFFDI
tara:strand:+ start:101 stop:862 length:762 start_codon:yes stop_codon:yes gene_type:complete